VRCDFTAAAMMYVLLLFESGFDVGGVLDKVTDHLLLVKTPRDIDPRTLNYASCLMVRYLVRLEDTKPA